MSEKPSLKLSWIWRYTPLAFLVPLPLSFSRCGLLASPLAASLVDHLCRINSLLVHCQERNPRRNIGKSLVAVVLVVLQFGIFACGEENKTVTGKAVVQLENSNLGLASDTPTVFKLKIVNAYLSEDIGDNGENVGTSSYGPTVAVWINSDCSGLTADCDIPSVSSFADFYSPEAINTELNSQDHPITVWEGEGDAPSGASREFRYVRIVSCPHNGEANMRWAAEGVTEQEVNVPICEISSGRMDPALSLKEGESVVIDISYSLAGSVASGDGLNTVGDNGGACSENDSGTSTCFSLPDFTATVRVE